VIKSGDKVPADLRLLETANLQVRSTSHNPHAQSHRAASASPGAWLYTCVYSCSVCGAVGSPLACLPGALGMLTICYLRCCHAADPGGHVDRRVCASEQGPGCCQARVWPGEQRKQSVCSAHSGCACHGSVRMGCQLTCADHTQLLWVCKS
jgi:hypothetical protein